MTSRPIWLLRLVNMSVIPLPEQKPLDVDANHQVDKLRPFFFVAN